MNHFDLECWNSCTHCRLHLGGNNPDSCLLHGEIVGRGVVWQMFRSGGNTCSGSGWQDC